MQGLISKVLLGIDYKLKIIPVNNKRLKLEIWDTAGQEQFRSFATTVLKQAHGAILCYAVNDRKSFMNVEYWMELIKQSSSKNTPIVLVATKKDIDTRQYDFLPERCVDMAEGQALAAKYGIPFLETSAVDGTNVSEVFEAIGRQVLERYEPVPEPIHVPVEPERKGCFTAFLKLFAGDKKEQEVEVNKPARNSIMISSSIKKGVYQRTQG